MKAPDRPLQMQENFHQNPIWDPVVTLCGVFEDMQVPDKTGDSVRWMGAHKWSFYEIFIKTQHLEPCQDTTFPPCLPGVLENMDVHDGLTWSWGQMNGSSLMKLPWNFHQDPVSGTLSRLHLISMSLPGVLEDMEVPDEPWVGVRW